MNTVLLCSQSGVINGVMDKHMAHIAPGILHRAFSVCVFRGERSEILIQMRHTNKLFGGLWANACCSHPSDKAESITDAGERRLREELGFTCPLIELGSFVYRAEDSEGRGVEHEYDTVLIGDVDGEIDIISDPQEVIRWEWVNVGELRKDMYEQPERYAPWFFEVVKCVDGDSA